MSAEQGQAACRRWTNGKISWRPAIAGMCRRRIRSPITAHTGTYISAITAPNWRVSLQRGTWGPVPIQMKKRIMAAITGPIPAPTSACLLRTISASLNDNSGKGTVAWGAGCSISPGDVGVVVGRATGGAADGIRLIGGGGSGARRAPWMAYPSKNRCKSAARSAAVAYRARGDFCKHLRQTVSRSAPTRNRARCPMSAPGPRESFSAPRGLRWLPRALCTRPPCPRVPVRTGSHSSGFLEG